MRSKGKRRSRCKSKVKLNLKVRTYLIIILSSLIPIFFIATISINELNNILNKTLESRITSSYNNLANNAQNNYRNLSFNIENFANSQVKGAIASRNLSKILISSFNEYKYIENILILDSNFSIEYNAKNNPIKESLVDKIKESEVCNTIKITDFYCEDNKISQYFYYKIVEDNKLKGCVVFEINNLIFQVEELVNKDVGVEIYNSEFCIIASKEKNNLGTSATSDISKKIVESKSDFIYLNDNKIKSGFIYINDMTVIVNVYENQKQMYANNLNLKKNILFITILVLAFSLVISYRYYSKIEAMNKSSEGKDDHRVLKEVNEKINEVVINLDIIHEKNLDIIQTKQEILRLKNKLNSEESDRL